MTSNPWETQEAPPPLDAPGVFGPNCDQHVATTSGQGFFNSTVSGIAGALSFHDLLLNWLNGLAPGSDTIQIQTDTSANPVVYTPSNC